MKKVNVYTWGHGNISVNEIPYRVKIKRKEVTMDLIDDLVDWCIDNCENYWGYYWDDDYNGYIGFADKSEKILFCMSNDYRRYI